MTSPELTTRSAWRILAHASTPRATRSQALTGLLCAVLGFAVVVQVQSTRSEGLSQLRQDELVRLLDEVTRRTEDLQVQVGTLRAQRQELISGTDTERAAQEAAAQRAEIQGILAGRLPAQGQGLELVIRQRERPIPALVLYNVLEEARNAGAEVIQLGDLRLTASSYFVDAPGGVEVDGTVLEPPYRWLMIGNPDTIIPALDMPGGALAAVRNYSGIAQTTARDLVEITAVRTIETPRYATAAPVPEAG